MTQAKEGNTVKVHYTGSLDDGTVFDSSQDREPLEFQIGSQQIIPGFEDNVKGMEVGESKTFTVKPDQAYGERNEEMKVDVERAQLPEDLEPEVGMMLQVRGQDGSVSNVTVSEVGEDKVTLDANHPLAGQDLTFEIKLEDIS
jgi:FKBP-type peptidyl-prolyl cis-trans isomerase 2